MRRALPELRRVLDWYFEHYYGRTEGPGTTPFYCDPTRVGGFAVSPQKLARGTEAATFRLFVTLAMYQALRDVVVMRRQRSLSRAEVDAVADLTSVSKCSRDGGCPGLQRGLSITEYCDVWKRASRIDCGKHPGLECNVKHATRAFKRMGDMGKLPVSALEVGWSAGGLNALVADTIRSEASPGVRALLLVTTLQRVHRVGRKLATFFVSALSTPSLAPGLTPWFPAIDGNALVIIDTNVARAVDALRMGRGQRTYDARAEWLRRQAAEIDLRRHRHDVPSYSPRLVQQALYSFCSKSNRVAQGDSCREAAPACLGCARRLCPFTVPRRSAAT